MLKVFCAALLVYTALPSRLLAPYLLVKHVGIKRGDILESLTYTCA